MKYFLLYGVLVFYFTGKTDCDKLSNGKYLVHFTQGVGKDYRIKIRDSTFVQYFSSRDSACGKIDWIYKCLFNMKYSKQNSIDPLVYANPAIVESWGLTCIELNEVKKDTIGFRTTYSGNLHITINEGYFLRM